MNELNTQIQKYYDEFRKDLNQGNFPAVFELIKNHNSKNNLERKEHVLGTFSILYTQVRYKAEIMILGNNPSWFDKDNGAVGYRIVSDLMKTAPDYNSYIEDNHVFSSIIYQMLFLGFFHLD